MLDNILRNAETKVVVNLVGITLFRIILIFFLEYTYYTEYQHESIVKKEYEIGGPKFFVDIPISLSCLKNTCYEIICCFKKLITSDTIGKLDRFMLEIWHTLAHVCQNVCQIYYISNMSV